MKSCLASRTYSKTLFSLGLGEPQWWPEYQGRPGDVGFFLGGRGGYFYRLLNILRSVDDQSGPVPEDFEPFPAQLSRRFRDRNPQRLKSSQIAERSMEAGLAS